MNRRTFLRAAGATLWLPFLRSAPGMADPVDAVRRKVFFFVPNGFLVQALTPSTAGSGYTLPGPLAPIDALRDRISVITGLRNLSEGSTQFGFGTHEACTASLLTDNALEGNYYVGAARNGISVDQYAVRELRPSTPYQSLQLGTGERWINGGATIDLYYNHLSWANDATPLAPLVEPRAVFDRMFGGDDPGATAEEAERRAVLRRSVLDAVHERTSSLSRGLDAADRAKLDQYTTSVRELELRLAALEDVVCDPGSPPDPNLAFPERVDAMLALVRVALTCDLTRVATFMAATTTALTTFPSIGVSTDHHSLSHNWSYLERDRVDYLAVQSWYVDRYVRFLTSLQDVPDGESDLLSSTLVSLVSEFGDANAHVATETMLFAGGGEAAGLRHGRHLAAGGAPHANYLRSTLDFLDVDPEGFGHTATGTLDLR